MTLSRSSSGPLSRLRTFVRSERNGPADSDGRVAAGRNEKAADRCELCSLAIPERHRHLLEMATREIVCSCDPCALRFQLVVDGRFKLIPRDARRFDAFAMSDALWNGLGIPISLAFFVQDSQVDVIRAFYPSPGGVTESLLPLDSWGILKKENDVLDSMQPDVEALLVNRLRKTPQYFGVPIDRCYELAGLLRVHWRGISGGPEMNDVVDSFFDGLRRTALTH